MTRASPTPTLSAPHPVVAYQAERVLVALVGCGGTGSWAAAHLVHQVRRFNRLWNHAPSPRRAELLLVDYDLVEASNVEARQHFYPFEVGHPKAQVLANRFQLGFNLRAEEIKAVVRPFSPALIPQTTPEYLSIIVGCVDNAEARTAIAQVLESQAAPSPIWWIDAGNERDYGQILCGNTAKEADLVGALALSPGLTLPSPALLAPGLVIAPETAQESVSQVFSCGAVQVNGGPAQSDTINFTMAGIVATYVHALLFGTLRTFATFVNLANGVETRSEPICAHTLAAALGHADPAFAHSLLAAPTKQGT